MVWSEHFFSQHPEFVPCAGQSFYFYFVRAEEDIYRCSPDLFKDLKSKSIFSDEAASMRETLRTVIWQDTHTQVFWLTGSQSFMQATTSPHEINVMLTLFWFSNMTLLLKQDIVMVWVLFQMYMVFKKQYLLIFKWRGDNTFEPIHKGSLCFV